MLRLVKITKPTRNILFLMYLLFLMLYRAFFNNFVAFSVFLGPEVTLKNSTLSFLEVLLREQSAFQCFLDQCSSYEQRNACKESSW